MSWFDRIFGLEKHDLTPTPPITMVGFPANGGILPGGVTATTALGLSSVWRCLQVLSNGVSQLEWRESRGTLDTLPLSRLVRRPQADRTRREWTSIVVNTLALYQVCYLLRLGEDAEGVPESLYYLAPPLVQPATPMDVYGLLPISEYWVAGRRVSADRLHIIRTGLLPGIPDHLGGLIDMARVTFAAAIASENYASRFWQGGASPVTKIKTDQALTPTQADELRNEWDTKQQLGRSTAVFGLGADANPFGADITQAAAVEARRELVADIARYFGVPTRLVNAPTGDSETYTTTESANMDLLRFTLADYVGAIEDAISDELPGGRRMTMDTLSLTKGTELARAQALQLATGGKAWMLPADAREHELLPPLDDADLEKLNPPAPEPIAAGAQRAEPAAQRTAP